MVNDVERSLQVKQGGDVTSPLPILMTISLCTFSSRRPSVRPSSNHIPHSTYICAIYFIDATDFQNGRHWWSTLDLCEPLPKHSLTK